jgi:hypothetical protein
MIRMPDAGGAGSWLLEKAYVGGFQIHDWPDISKSSLDYFVYKVQDIWRTELHL